MMSKPTTADKSSPEAVAKILGGREYKNLSTQLLKSRPNRDEYKNIKQTSMNNIIQGRSVGSTNMSNMSRRMPINVMAQGIQISRVQSAVPNNQSIRNSTDNFLMINKYGSNIIEKSKTKSTAILKL